MPYKSVDYREDQKLAAATMNQVQLLKNRFEKLNSDIESLDITPLRVKNHPPNKFKRSATCIDFSKLKLDEAPKDPAAKDPAKPQFQRQLSNSSNSSYKSIRRSPAFRFDAQSRPSVAKSVTKELPVQPKSDFNELEYLTTSATIKKALLKPLPTGSPPKKPPRIFLSSQPVKNIENEPSPESIQSRIRTLKISPHTIPKKVSKTEDKKAISSFLNCIISPCSIDPIYYEQIRKEQQQKKRVDSGESIYMEPFAHLKEDFANKNKSPKANEELHYMCTILDPQPSDLNGNQTKEETTDLRRSSLDSTEMQDYEKVNDCSFDSVIAQPSTFDLISHAQLFLFNF